MGLLVGILYAYFFYALLYILREIFRVLSTTGESHFWIFTEKEVNFYNLYFASIAVITAQNICFNHWFNKPKRIFSLNTNKRNRIVNDQTVLTWSFLSWFSKLAFLFGLFFGIVFKGGFYVFQFYPKYNYVFILMAIVLFLHSWISIRLINKKKSLKWMGISLVVVSTLSYGLSKIDIIDYKTLNKNFIKSNLIFKYPFELPESDFYEGRVPKSDVEKIYITRETKTRKPIIIIENKIVPLNNLAEYNFISKVFCEPFESHMIRYELYIDKNINMEFISKVKNELAKNEVLLIGYAVVPSKTEFDKRYYTKCFFYKLLDPPTNYPPPPNTLIIDSSFNIIEVEYTSKGNYLINGITTNKSALVNSFKTLIKANPNYLIRVNVSNEMSFEDYFTVLSTSRVAINEIRNEYSLKTYSLKLEELEYSQMDSIRYLHPWRIIDKNPEDY